jgi:hypothetical protein
VCESNDTARQAEIPTLDTNLECRMARGISGGLDSQAGSVASPFSGKVVDDQRNDQP